MLVHICAKRAQPNTVAPAVQAQQAVGDGTRVVDVLLTWPGGRLAVEVDGPHHFLTDPDTGARRRNGATVLRDAQLRRWGLDVLSVPVEDRSLAELRSAAFRAELAAMLRDRGVPLESGAAVTEHADDG